MKPTETLKQYAPLFAQDRYSEKDKKNLAPFFTNLDKPVYAPLIISPELIGALCSRTSRAAEDLRHIYLREFLYPFTNPVREEKDTDESWREKTNYGNELRAFIDFLQSHPLQELFSNPRARSFYIKWLAQYGDDSIAQMAGSHLVFSSLSQVAIKHLEDQRIGLAPIEKSTRYVNYAGRVNGSYLYYADPTLKKMGYDAEYREAMDVLFETYKNLIPRLTEWLMKKFPQEKPSVVEKKAFDSLRGLLPTATLSQVSFFGNGQAFEHMINRSAGHPLGEIRWAAESAYQELYQVTPAFLRRIKDEDKKTMIAEYQAYLSRKGERVARVAKESPVEETGFKKPGVVLVESDPEGEAKIVAAMLYSATENHASWSDLFAKTKKMPVEKKEEIISAYLHGRNERWQKVGRAFENVYNRFDILLNIGAWRDIHRHRMLTQQRQHFTVIHGYDVPPEVKDAGLEKEFSSAIKKVEGLFQKIEARDPDLAQYCVTLAHRVRFMQWENLRQSFWQIELRSIPEGHPDYRHMAQEKFHLLERAYPLIAKHIRANMGEYDFARRGQEEKIQKKLQQLTEKGEGG